MPFPHVKSRSEELISLQILRGCAAWLVVFLHYMQGFHSFQYSTWIGQFFVEVGRLGVDIFFVISGFIMYWTLAQTHYSARQFFFRRVIRIVPVYWFMTAIFLPVIYYFPSQFASAFKWDASSLAQSLLFIPHQNPSGLGLFPVLTVGWTLNFEMFFYVLLSLMLLAFRKQWFLVCAAAMFMMPFVWDRTWPYASILSSNLLYEFAIGMILANIFLRWNKRNHRYSPLIGAAFIVTGAFVYWTGYFHMPPFDFTKTPFLWRVGNLTSPISATMLVCAGLTYEQHLPKGRVVGALRRLGDISYSTYLVHVLVLCIAIHVLGVPSTLAGELTAVAVYTAMTFLASEISYRWFETGPVTSFLKRGLLAPRAQSALVREQGL